MTAPPPFAGMSVAQVMEYCDAAYDRLTLIDEPPGRLRLIALDCGKESESGRIALDVAGDAPLFAADRRWRPDEVMALTVQRVLGPGEEAF